MYVKGLKSGLESSAKIGDLHVYGHNPRGTMNACGRRRKVGNRHSGDGMGR